MPFKKGEGGRPRGAKNKTTLAFKQALLGAFSDLGGQAALVKWGRDNQSEFYKLCGRLIPQEVSMAAQVRPVVIDVVTQKDVSDARAGDTDAE